MSWCVSVDEPRIGSPAARACSRARRSSTQSKPRCWKKRASSAATTARGTCTEIWSVARHR